MSSLSTAYNKKNAKMVFVDESHLDRFLHKVTTWCTGVLDRVQDRLADVKNDSQRVVMDWGRQNRTYPNMCALSQEIICAAFDASALEHKPFLSNGIHKSVFSHCATVLPFTFQNEPEVERIALIDPTFNQFQMPSEIFSHSGIPDLFAGRQPKFILEKTETGRALWDQLSGSGYALLDEEKAGRYLESLFGRVHYSPSESLTLMKAPPAAIKEPKHGLERVLDVAGSFPDLRNLHAATAAQNRDFFSTPGLRQS